MKTLDEVIVELEDEGVFADALYYLREYRAEKATLEITKENYQDAIANCEKAENKFKTALKKLDIGTLNDPLTWDELKAMKDKPVWVEEENQPSQWYLIDEVETDEDDDPEFVSMTVFDCQGDYWFYKNNMGTKWQAYRKERK